MAVDADIPSAIKAIKAASKKIKLTRELEESIEQLNSITKLLEIDVPSPAVLQRLSLLLRQTLLPLYNTFLILGIRYAVAVLGTIFNVKVLPALKNRSSVAVWEAVQVSLLSGVLDFLESTSSYETRDIVANFFYPTLRGVFFPRTNLTFRPGPDLMYILCQVLSETVTAHPDNQAQLRNKDVLGGADLGLILSQSKNILVIEGLLELIVKLLPSKRTSAAARIEFMQDVFDAANFACGDVILKILETTPPTANWDIIFIKIIDILGKTDSSFPQPFKISNFHVQDSEKAYNIGRLYVDHLGFVANIDEGDQIETLHALYASIQSLKVATPRDGKAAVIILFSPPPSVGQVALVIPSDRGATVAFDIEAEDVASFLSSLKLRNVKGIDPPGKKLSKLEESLDLNFKLSDKNPVLSTQDKGRDLARLWDLSNSQSHAGQVLPTSPLMPRATSEVQDASTSANPTKPLNRGSAAKTSSPYYDSIFGTTDEELTDPSDTELNPPPRRSTRLSRGKQLRSVGKPPPKVVESDNESQIIRKVKSRRKTIVLSDIETDRIKSPSQNVPETAKLTLSMPTGSDSRPPSKLKAQSLAEGNLPDNKVADGGKADQLVLKPDSVADSTRQPDLSPSRTNERPEPRRKRKSADDIPEINGPDSERPSPKRRRIAAKNPTESKPPPKPAPARRYGRKGRASSPTLPSGHELAFEVIPVPSDCLSKLEEEESKVSTIKDKGGKTSAARAITNKKKPKTTEKSTDVSTVVPLKKARTKARTEDKVSLDDTNRPLPVKMATEDKDKHSSKPAPQRRAARAAKAPHVANQGTKIKQRNLAMPIVEPVENLEDEDTSDQSVRLQKKPRHAPWEEIDVKRPLSTANTSETIIASAVLPAVTTVVQDAVAQPETHVETPAVVTVVQDAIAQPETHVTVETSGSATILPEAGAQKENYNVHMLDTDSVKPASFKKSAEDESKPSNPKIHRILIDLTEDSPLTKAPTKSIVEKESELRIKSPTPPPPADDTSNRQLITSTITLPPSPESRHSLSKSDRPRVSFAPSASVIVHSTLDTTPELEFETSELSHYPKKNENYSPSNKYRRPQSHAQKLFENEYVQPMTRKRDTDPMQPILGILDEINKVMKHKSSYRFSKVRKDLQAGERAILRETAQHLEDTYVESAQHHNNFVNLEAQYASHHRKIINGLKDAYEDKQKTATFLAATIQEHNRNSLSRKFPNNFFNSPLPSILLNPQLKL